MYSRQAQESKRSCSCCGVPCCVQDAADFPTDVDFKWAQDSYNVTQRNIDTWLFFGTFRARLWLLEQKWSYAGGFTGRQQGQQQLQQGRVLGGWVGVVGVNRAAYIEGSAGGSSGATQPAAHVSSRSSSSRTQGGLGCGRGMGREPPCTWEQCQHCDAWGVVGCGSRTTVQ